MATWTLEPPEAFRPDPECSHCTRNPGYQHRHWRQRQEDQAARPPDWEPNWGWRLAFKIMGPGHRDKKDAEPVR